MTDEDYLTAVLNCDDQSGMATDAAWRAVSALRARAEQAEAAIERVRELHRQSPFIDECIECAPGGTYYWPCPTIEALADGAS